MFGKELPYILSDCDGTISNQKLEVSVETKKSIIKYQKKSGYHFSFVTGRLGVATKVLAQELKIGLPVISCNGALISDLETDKVLFAKFLKKDLVLKIINECEELGIESFVYTTHQMAGVVGNPRLILWKKYREDLKKKDHWPILEYDSINEFKSAISSQIIKPVQLLLYAPFPNQQEVVKELLKKYKRVVEANQSLPFMFNITVKGVNKLTGLKEWAKIVGVSYKKVIAIGDNYNDLPLIKGIKKGLVVGNGVPELKKVAYKVLKPMEENGVGIELERIIRKYE